MVANNDSCAPVHYSIVAVCDAPPHSTRYYRLSYFRILTCVTLHVILQP